MADHRDAWALAVLASELDDSIKVTCWAIREWANREGSASFGIKKLCERLRKSETTIKRHIRKLVSDGWLERIPGAGAKGRGGTTTKTVLRIPSRVTMDDTTSGAGPARSGVTQGDTPSPNRHAQFVTPSDPICHPSGATRHRKGGHEASKGGPLKAASEPYIEPYIEPYVRARAREETHAHEDGRISQMLEMLRAGEPEFRVRAAFHPTAAELEILMADSGPALGTDELDRPSKREED